MFLGELRVGEGIDRETLEHYILTVHVLDKEFPEQECVIYADILLSDVNDSPPTFYTDKYIIDIYENAPVGTPIIKLQAVDNDTGILCINNLSKYIKSCAQLSPIILFYTVTILSLLTE